MHDWSITVYATFANWREFVEFVENMSDFFELLSFPRLPWLNPADVKSRFTELSAPVHPDRVHQTDDATRRSATNRYAELNSATQALSQTRSRLKHLIALEIGESPSDVGSVPPHISDLFFEVGQIFTRADKLIAEREQENSPMVQVEIMQRALALSDEIQSLQSTLNDQVQLLDEKCLQLNDGWASSDSKPIKEATTLYRDYSYLNKWQDQAQEKRLQLTLF